MPKNKINKKEDSIGKINPLKGMIFSALFAAFTAAIAPIKIPLGFTPVPITLQTFGVLLSGTLLGPYYGALSMLLYIAVGAIGLPVFAGGSSGLGVLLGPTGGYLISYPIAAFFVGVLSEKKSRSSLLKYISLGILLFLFALIYSDLFFNVGIMKIWDKETKSYMPLIQNIGIAARYIIAIGSLSAIIALVLIIFYFNKCKEKNIPFDAVLAMVVGTLIIYILGALQGKYVTKLPWPTIFAGWVLPFLIGDTIKLLVAAHLSNNINLRRHFKWKKE